MRIAPRYDGPPVVRIGGAGPEMASLVVQQRRRLGDALERLDDDQWSAPSRCAGWTVRDVASHLATTNQFFAYSLRQGFAGDPTRLLVGFDPVASPAELVEADRHLPPEGVLDAYLAGCAALAAVLDVGDDTAWDLPAEAPPGHLPASSVALHALWDAWVHERDILLPLGIVPSVDAAEVGACLRYSAALGPGFLASIDEPVSGAVAVVSTDPVVRIVVALGTTVVVEDGDAAAGTPTLTGPAVDLVEALSRRGPFPAATAPEVVALLSGLDRVFDQA